MFLPVSTGTVTYDATLRAAASPERPQGWRSPSKEDIRERVRVGKVSGVSSWSTPAVRGTAKRMGRPGAVLSMLLDLPAPDRIGLVAFEETAPRSSSHLLSVDLARKRRRISRGKTPLGAGLMKAWILQQERGRTAGDR